MELRIAIYSLQMTIGLSWTIGGTPGNIGANEASRASGALARRAGNKKPPIDHLGGSCRLGSFRQLFQQLLGVHAFPALLFEFFDRGLEFLARPEGLLFLRR